MIQLSTGAPKNKRKSLDAEILFKASAWEQALIGVMFVSFLRIFLLKQSNNFNHHTSEAGQEALPAILYELRTHRTEMISKNKVNI